MADQDLQIRASLVIQTLRKKVGGGGGAQKNFFQPFGPQFGLKIRGWGGEVPLEPSHGSTTDQGGRKLVKLNKTISSDIHNVSMKKQTSSS